MSIVIEQLSKKQLNWRSRQLAFALKQPKIQAYTMLIMSLFTIAFFSFFALRPTLVTIAQLRRQIKDSKQVDKRLAEKITQLVAAQAEYEIIAPFIPKIKQALPEKPGYVKMLLDIEKIRTTAEATISNVTIDKVVIHTKQSGSLDIDLSAQGGFAQLERLITRILANERLLKIETFNLAQKQAESKNSNNNTLGLTTALHAPYVGKEE